MSELVRGVFSTTRSKRRRLFWAAWWTGPPAAEPFRKPDAWGGGAKDAAEAKALAERAASMPLEEAAGSWAGAWVRILAGSPPFPRRPEKAAAPPRPLSAREILGVASGATDADVKAAFRRRAAETHPDKGGTAEAFIAVKRAYDSLAERKRRKR